MNDAPGFLQRMVHEEDQQQYGWNYWNRVQAQAYPTTFRFRGKRKDGSTFEGRRSIPLLGIGGAHT